MSVVCVVRCLCCALSVLCVCLCCASSKRDVNTLSAPSGREVAVLAAQTLQLSKHNLMNRPVLSRHRDNTVLKHPLFLVLLECCFVTEFLSVHRSERQNHVPALLFITFRCCALLLVTQRCTSSLPRKRKAAMENRQGLAPSVSNKVPGKVARCYTCSGAQRAYRDSSLRALCWGAPSLEHIVLVGGSTGFVGGAQLDHFVERTFQPACKTKLDEIEHSLNRTVAAKQRQLRCHLRNKNPTAHEKPNRQSQDLNRQAQRT